MTNSENFMTLENLWSDEGKRRRVFTWMARIGAAPKFGTRPIGWYQQDMVAALEKLEALAGERGIVIVSAPLRYRRGCVEARTEAGWRPFARVFAGQLVLAK